MRRLIVFIAVVLTAISAAAAFYLIPLTPYSGRSSVASFRLSSEAFSDGGVIPTKYTCDGLDVSPPLYWSDYPSNTKSFVLIMEDIDAPGGVFTHWLIYNISASMSRLTEGVENLDVLSGGALQGINDFNRIGYGGPCPPPGKPHRYVFRLYALDEVLDLKPKLTRHALQNSIKDHIIAEAQLIGTYSR